MRRASSLFEIDQEPLFETAVLVPEASGAPDWDLALDEFPEALAPSRDHEAEEPERQPPMTGRRSRLLAVAVAIGAVGFLGSRLTQNAGTPNVPPSAASEPPAAVAATRESAPAPRAQTTHPPGAHASPAPRRDRGRGAQRAARTAPKVGRRQPAPSAPRPVAPVPTPAPTSPPRPAQEPAPEPQGFTGEFF